MNDRRKRIFVAGAGSFIGQRLLAQCDALGISVCGVDLAPVDRPDCRIADICDSSIADLIPDDVDAVVNLAAISRDSDCRGKAYACFDVNVMGNLMLMDAAAARRAGQFIFASSEWVYDDYQPGSAKIEDDAIDPSRLSSEYAFSKLVGEINLRQRYAQGFCPVSILRFGIVYGSRHNNWSAVETLLHQVATQDTIRVGSRATTRCFIHVDDIAAAISAAIGISGFEIFNIQGDHPVSLGDVIDASARLLQKTPSIIEHDARNPSIRIVSNRKAKAHLAWQPQINLFSGLRSVAEFLKFPALS